MLQNSLDRLLVGMAEALHTRVLPALDDPAAAAQVRAMIELLGNLSTRVAWDPGYLTEIRRRVRPALDALVAVDGVPEAIVAARDTAPADPTDAAALRTEVVGHLEALATGQAWLEGPVADSDAARSAVGSFADWYLQEEMGRLRSARFGRPGGDG